MEYTYIVMVLIFLLLLFWDIRLIEPIFVPWGQCRIG